MSRPHSNGAGAAFDPMAMLARATRRRMTPEKFWAKVDRSSDGCWPWTGRLLDGHGTVSWCWRDVGAHRVAYAISHGPLLDGQVVRHTCDNPPCCRPDHLVVGTIADNNADMVERGRNATEQLVHRGATNVNAKLTDALVAELRAAWRGGESIKSIVRRTGLAVGTVHPMLHGKTWKHVADIVEEASS